MSIQDLKIRTRLILAFGLMVALILVIAAAALLKSQQLLGEFGTVVRDQYPKITQVHRIKAAEATNEVALANVLTYRMPDAVKAQIETLQATRRQVASLFAELQASIVSSGGKAALQAAQAARTPVLALQDKFLEAMDMGLSGDAATLLEKEMPAPLGAYKQAIDKLLDFQGELMDRSIAQADASVQAMQWIVALASLAAIVLGLLLAWSIVRSITRPLHEAVAVAGAVAGGDLTRRIAASGKSETAQLLQALQRMQDGLVRVVTLVRQDSEGVATASAEIAQGNQDLSARTESQASALEQTAASMEELNTTVRQNADNALQANQLAQNASEVARRGGSVVADVVRTMKQINDSSGKIASIIQVIDSIAFQTNILALNAAVEAARAGEQGRGFAVVASEVRSLAGRSAEAAREIKQLIDTSVQQVEAGSTLVDRAGRTMQEVVQAIERVTDIMGEISAASSEQSQGVAQVGEAVAQMDQATQQNAALVEQMAAAASSLNTQARELVGAVATFRLSEAPGVRPAGAAGTAQFLPVAKPPSGATPARLRASERAAAPAGKAEAAGKDSTRRPGAGKTAPRLPAAGSSGGDQDWESF
ncbi:methyl-accepting chemotaxis protein [Comamonas sp. NLF-1-9]|uniref:methyl-accepting chemotaxis protein n=1 Tax=Comamonas sp. NLF-1-9 TaxID=2853163 RepID=UPI001C47C434|nr:methyl-accepting chemotaxis protein [Comamonas sp. NLF-1-9]QXL83478.1 MCP four helix bundle domain-containing protein [Comamonas sp. NLF-1-9]